MYEDQTSTNHQIMVNLIFIERPVLSKQKLVDQCCLDNVDCLLKRQDIVERALEKVIF